MSSSFLSPYDEGVYIVKKYGDYTVKVCLLPYCRISGLESNRKILSKSSQNSINRLSNSISRSRSRVWELAMCNPWQYWCTFTTDEKKIDRFNLDTYQKKFSEFIHNTNRRRLDNDKVRYILIPELCKDGAFHMHGFINGLLDRDMIPTGNFNPKTGAEYLTWRRYHQEFGFFQCHQIDGIANLVKYSIKYMSKDICKTVTESGAHLYYASKGLKTAELIYKGHAVYHGDWQFVHPDGYVKSSTLDLRETTIEEHLEVMP